eukprot:COSAG02_NODE_37241_length_444_cov_1.043478_1_plen_66_part_01
MLAKCMNIHEGCRIVPMLHVGDVHWIRLAITSTTKLSAKLDLDYYRRLSMQGRIRTSSLGTVAARS